MVISSWGWCCCLPSYSSLLPTSWHWSSSPQSTMLRADLPPGSPVLSETIARAGVNDSAALRARIVFRKHKPSSPEGRTTSFFHLVEPSVLVINKSVLVGSNREQLCQGAYSITLHSAMSGKNLHWYCILTRQGPDLMWRSHALWGAQLGCVWLDGRRRGVNIITPEYFYPVSSSLALYWSLMATTRRNLGYVRLECAGKRRSLAVDTTTATRRSTAGIPYITLLSHPPSSRVTPANYIFNAVD